MPLRGTVNSMRTLTLGPLVVALLIAAPVPPAHAQSDTGEVVVPGVGVMTTRQIEDRIATLEKQYNEVNLTGPRAGVGITAILVPGAAFMIAAGAGLRSFERTFFCPPDDPSCGDPSAGSAAMIGLGVAALIGGLVGVGMTTAKLRRRKAERARIRGEIDQLERSLPEPSH